MQDPNACQADDASIKPMGKRPGITDGVCLILPLLLLIVFYGEHEVLANKQAFFQGRALFAKLLTWLPVVYAGILGLAYFSDKFRHYLKEKAPMVSAVVSLLILWDLVTLKWAFLPLPYFPSPGVVVGSLISEREMLLVSALYSLRLLFFGYFIGLAVGLPTGVLMGWSPRFHYWLNPLLKMVGPIPAISWIPIAMAVFPTSFLASIFLIALACWFPLTIMTWSGIANVNKSYYEVARSLGASEWYLISRVALPAAMPTIFVGLFMGLGLSFVTLIVGEMVGVKAGLGWFITWAQGWAEFGKVYAALIIMAILFSTIITLLFLLRDRVLIWQKGLIKW